MVTRQSVPGPKRGKKPKNLRQQLADDSARKNLDEPQFSQVTNVECPEWIGPQGRALWETYAPELCKEKVLSVTDIHNLECFCSAYQSFRESQSELAKEGPVIENCYGNMVKNPAATVMNEAMRQIAIFGANLGLDPASRTRLTGTGKKESNNPFEGM